MKDKDRGEVDKYISQQSDAVREKLEQIRKIISTTVPDAVEIFSYRMPCFRYYGMLAYYAAFTNHYSIFVSPEVLNAFKSRLGEYQLSKSGIKIQNSLPVPVKLLREIITYAAERNRAKAEMKKTANKTR
jgi:uncharacterized protein YdhG (YjbR/CyaY superfamily)